MNMQGIGRKLKASRIEAGYDTPEAIAALMHTTPQSVRNWEAGRHRISADALAKWAQVVGKPYAYFVEEQQDLPPAPSAHPGVEALARDPALRARHHVTDAELADLRQIIMPNGLVMATVEAALRGLDLLRAQ